MAKSNQTKKLKIATLVLTLVMLLSFCSFLFTACSKSNSSDDDDDSSVQKTDTQTFANADFEFFNDNSETYLIATPDSWTSSTVSNDSGISSSSSIAKSGIVDTSIDWKQFVQAFDDYEYYSSLDDDDEALEDAEYYKDIDDNYDIPGWDLAKAKKTGNDSEDTDPTTEEITAESTALNPGTHWSDASDKADLDEKNGTHVLMLHNYRSNGKTTATKYTSASITLSAGTAASFSVWVKTAGLTYNNGTSVNGNRGAFIEVSTTVGSTEKSNLVVRNIDTSDVQDNNGWEQYTFYVKASQYAATSFTVSLGLGRQTESTSANEYEYVQGYAFFDDLQYSMMTAQQFDADLATNVPDASQRTKLDLTFDNDLDKFDAQEARTKNAFSIDLNDIAPEAISFNGVTAEKTSDKRAQVVNTVDSYFGAQGLELTANEQTDLELSGFHNASDFVSGSKYNTTFLKAFENFNSLPFGGDNQKVLVLYSSLGAPYTAKMGKGYDATSASTSSISDIFTLDDESRMLISFWVKTNELQGGTGATVTLVNNDTKSTIGAVDTTTLDTVNIKDDSSTNANKDVWEDIFDGWKKCSFYVSNYTGETVSFSLEFNFGPTAIAGTSISSFVPGFAAFTGFEATILSDEQYNLKSTDSYAVDVALSAETSNASNSFDEPAYTRPDEIETDLADLRNYTGVYGNSLAVGGTENTGYNLNTNAGLISKEYADKGNYTNKEWLDIVCNSYSGYTDTLTSDLWNEIFGADTTQPLLIANTVEQAYGFIANASTTLSASSYKAVTVRVKLSPGATANIYLIDAKAPEESSDKSFTNPLGFASGVSYRHDKDGNIVTKDPDADDFSNKTDILFYYNEETGLWAPTKNYTGDVFYANLANYEKDEDGNLIASDKSIIYYADENTEESGVYYRYSDDDGKLSVKVKDFTKSDKSADDLQKAKMQDSVSKDTALVQTVTNPSATKVSDWIYVRFFIAVGDESKDYRLEVWSGSRDGVTKNAADSFVIFDLVNYGDLTSEVFTALSESRLEKLAKEVLGEDATVEDLEEAYREDPNAFIEDNELVYFHYSLYDDKDYAPYNADYTSATNPYEGYTASSYSDTLAYLKYSFTDESGNLCYDTIVNYSAAEVAVTASSSDDSDSTDDTASGDSDTNVWLLVASIVLAAVLVFTLIALVVRKLLSNIKKRNVRKVAPTYDGKRKRYIRKLRLEESEKDDLANDVLPDEDEIPEEDLYKVDTIETELQESEEQKPEQSETTENTSSEDESSDKKDD